MVLEHKPVIALHDCDINQMLQQEANATSTVTLFNQTGVLTRIYCIQTAAEQENLQLPALGTPCTRRNCNKCMPLSSIVISNINSGILGSEVIRAFEVKQLYNTTTASVILQLQCQFVYVTYGRSIVYQLCGGIAHEFLLHRLCVHVWYTA